MSEKPAVPEREPTSSGENLPSENPAAENPTADARPLPERIERLRRRERERIPPQRQPEEETAGPTPGVAEVPARLETKTPNLRQLDAELEDELQAALAGFDEGTLIGREPAGRSGKPSEGPKRGRIVAIHGGDVFVDLPGGRSQGVLSLQQFPEGRPSIGDPVDVEIDRYDAANGLLLLRRLGAVQTVDWSSVAVGMTVEARVTGTNKGGLSVDVNGIRGFMPISQIDLYRVEQPEQFLNQRLRCVVTEVKPEERNLVVSRRALLERERDEQREKFWAGLEVGQVRQGVVRSIQPFGVFVDLGGADGMIPTSELSWSRIGSAEEVVKVGERVEVKVVRLDRAARKIGLSLKQTQSSPWDDIAQRYYPGLIVARKVSRLAEFGAFVELEPGIEGLVHLSEISLQRIRKPGAVLQPGQEVNVKVLSVDKENRRISLSIKQAMAAPAEEESATAPETAPEPPKEKERPRNVKLRGGIGNQWFIPGKEEASG